MKRWFGLTLLVVFFLAPLFLLVTQSLSGRWVYPEVLPGVWSLNGWGQLMARTQWLGPLLSSLGFSLATWGLASLLCFPAAAALARSGTNTNLWESLLLAPAVVPALTTAFGNHLWMTWMGWTDSVFALVPVLTFYTYPYLLRALTAGYRLLGADLSRAAGNLGASRAQVFWKVEFPLLFPAWVAGGSIVFLGAFSDYFLVSLFGGGVVPAFSTYLVPVLGGSDRTWGSVLTLVFLVGPLVLLGALDIGIKRWMAHRGLSQGVDHR